jgi:hypothetical protein
MGLLYLYLNGVYISSYIFKTTHLVLRSGEKYIKYVSSEDDGGTRTWAEMRWTVTERS